MAHVKRDVPRVLPAEPLLPLLHSRRAATVGLLLTASLKVGGHVGESAKKTKLGSGSVLAMEPAAVA